MAHVSPALSGFARNCRRGTIRQLFAHGDGTMSPSLEQLKATLAGLPVAERAELAQYLLRSLGSGEEEGAKAEWLALAEQRMAEVRAGRVAGIPAEAVLEIAPGILRSMQAFWRERPELLKNRRNHGQIGRAHV